MTKRSRHSFLLAQTLPAPKQTPLTRNKPHEARRDPAQHRLPGGHFRINPHHAFSGHIEQGLPDVDQRRDCVGYIFLLDKRQIKFFKRGILQYQPMFASGCPAALSPFAVCRPETIGDQNRPPGAGQRSHPRQGMLRLDVLKPLGKQTQIIGPRFLEILEKAFTNSFLRRIYTAPLRRTI
ncbi:MAG: hypothetical protein ACJA1F_000439 [Paracoccaceae bacterium]|jgi:hypothetical protein